MLGLHLGQTFWSLDQEEFLTLTKTTIACTVDHGTFTPRDLTVLVYEMVPQLPLSP